MRKTLGKRMRESVYLHVSALEQLPERTRQAVETARRIAGVDGRRFDVVKLGLRRPTVSFLAYPSFFKEGFPRLREAWTVDLARGTCAHRAYSGNVPILHRKEEMLPIGHPAIPRFVRLTREAERRGLFSDPSAIGNTAAWNARLRRLGLRVVGHRLVAAR
jgi:DNA phosphorothioation-associated putative methyltransferase